METQVTPEHYLNDEYLSPERFASAATQLQLIRSLGPTTMLECGVGSGLLRLLVNEYAPDVAYDSIDIDPGLKPNHIGSVTALPFAPQSYGTVCCFEVLEHIPFQQAKEAIRGLCSIAQNTVIISVPDVTPYFGFALMHPFASKISPTRPPGIWSMIRNPRKSFLRTTYKSLLPLPSLPMKHVFRGEHYWEIGKSETPLSAFLEILQQPDMTLEHNFRSWHCPYHHFFVLRRNAS